MVNPPAWDEAGFTDASTGRLDRRIPSGKVIVPQSIELHGDLLVWKYAVHFRDRVKAYIPKGDVLNGFVRLWKGTPFDEAVRPENGNDYRKRLEAQLLAARKRTLRYAQDYGVLLLGKDGTPAFNWDVEGAEPLRVWWYTSRKACAFLSLAAALDRGRLGDVADWSVIDPKVDPRFPRHPNPYVPHGIAAARERFQVQFAHWLHFARVTFALVPKEGHGAGWATEIDYGGRLFSAIVLQLLLTLSHAGGLFICSGCALPYLRPKGRKRPNANEANFCQACGKGNRESLRLADRRRQEKMRSARRLRHEGVPVKEIAEQLETTTESVRRWIKKGK